MRRSYNSRKTLDEKYAPFARKLRLLAQEFEDEQILALVKQFMDM